MKHTHPIAIHVLKNTYADYPRNEDHYDREYKMLVSAVEEQDKQNPWVLIKKDTIIPDRVELLLYNEKWIDKDFNPNGTRVGFKCDLTNWTSAQYVDMHDTYFTRYADEDNESFKLSKANDQIPTHYKLIIPPKNL